MSDDKDGRPDHGHSMVGELGDYRLRYLSVSTMQKADVHSYGGCLRKLYINKVMKVAEPTTKGKDRGKEEHRGIENYLRTGDGTLSRLTIAGKHFIPRPGPDLLIEFDIASDEVLEAREQVIAAEKVCEASGNDGADVDYAVEAIRRYNALVREKCALDLDGVPFVGFIDLLMHRDHYLNNEGATIPHGKKVFEAEDWKTTSSIKNAKSVAELASTVQMVGYGVVGSKIYPECDHARLSHGIFVTQGAPQAEKRSTIVPVEKLLRSWEALIPLKRTIEQVIRETDYKKVDPNWDACDAFRGCPYQSYCPRSTEKIIASLVNSTGKGNIMAGLMDKLTNLSKPTTSTSTAVAEERKKIEEEERAIQAAKRAPAEEAKAEPVKEAPPVTSTPASTPKKGSLLGALAGMTPAVKSEAKPAAKVEAKPEVKSEAKPAADPKTGRVCSLCKVAVLTAENSSKLPDGTVIHIGCPERSRIGAPEKIVGTKVADPVPPEVAVTLPPEIRAAAEKVAPFTPPPPKPEKEEKAKKTSSKCGASGRVVEVTSAQAALGKLTCPDCGVEVKCKVQVLGDKAIASIPKHEPPKPVVETKPEPVVEDKAEERQVTMCLEEKAVTVTDEERAQYELEHQPDYRKPEERNFEQEDSDRISDKIVEREERLRELDRTVSQFPSRPFVPGELAAVTSDSDAGIDLFVDCSVTFAGRQPPERLENYIDAILRMMEKEFKVTDIRSAPKDSPLGYGGWKGVLASVVRADPPPAGAYIVDLGISEIKSEVIDAIRPLCRLVVRGR